MSRHLDTTPQSSRDLGYAKSLLRDFIVALDQPEDVRDKFIAYAKTHAERELAPGGRLSNEFG